MQPVDNLPANRLQIESLRLAVECSYQQCTEACGCMKRLATTGQPGNAGRDDSVPDGKLSVAVLCLPVAGVDRLVC